MTTRRAPWRRALTGAGVALALVGGSLAAAGPLEHVPVYRYYLLMRTDARPHPIKGFVRHTLHHRDSLAVEFVMETLNGRQYVWDRAMVGPEQLPNIAANGHGTYGCRLDLPACEDEDFRDSPISMPFRVYHDFFIAIRDGEVTAHLSDDTKKHWVLKELTGDVRTTGRLHVLMASDGDVTSANVGGVVIQRITDIGHPGGPHGSVAMAISPHAQFGLTSVGSAVLDGGRTYTMGVRRLERNVSDVVASHPGPTHWRLHGDLTVVGLGSTPTLLVYDLPDPKALRAFLRRR